MTVFSWDQIDTISESKFYAAGTALSAGSFDGLHLGHRFLLQSLKDCAKKKFLSSGVITFSRPLPAIKHSSDYTGDISTLNQRLKLFKELGIDFVIVVDFTESFSSLKGTDFLSILKDKCNMKVLAEGIDFRCGYKGATDTQAIKYWAEQNKVECCFVDPVYYTEADGNEERVSSSYIRQMIQKGFFNRVKELLERPYSIDVQNLRDKKGGVQVLPPDGLYHPVSEENKMVTLEILDQHITIIPDCQEVFFS